MADQSDEAQATPRTPGEKTVTFSSSVTDSTPSTQRPTAAERQESYLSPYQRDSITAIPVTPGIDAHTYTAHLSDDHGPGSGHSYFRGRTGSAVVASPDAVNTNVSTQAPGGSGGGGQDKSGHEELRRLSAGMRTRRESLSDVRAANPKLSLSGNVISATFSAPQTVRYRKGQDWGLESRRGQSALLDSFAYLSSDEAAWNHTVVAWIGEIKTSSDSTSTTADTPPTTTAHLPALNNLSAPIPVDGTGPSTTPPATSEGLWLPSEDIRRLEQQLSHHTIKTVPVWLTDDSDRHVDGLRLKDQARWRKYAEHELYTLFHYKQHEPNDGRAERIQWADYYRMNQKFANRILEIYKPGDVVLVHDYHLMLLPSMLRQRAPHMYIGFFLHSPFPSSEFLRCLPRRKEVLEGVLGSNLVGFQSYSYSRHFSSCCTRILNYPSDVGGVDAYGSRIEVGVFPIGIDAIKVESTAFSSTVDEKFAALKKLYHGKKIIVGRDRLDSVRGVAQKLMAFERFLELYPDWREKVVLIQVTSPTSIEEEKEDPENKIASRVNGLVMKINGAYGNLGFDPVRHYPQYLSQDEYFALLRAGDIGLITSVRDGMNTTSLEYVICQREHDGPLILSEFSGTAGSLKDAIHINPWDLTGVADQINNALTMSTEKRADMQRSLYAHVVEKDVRGWVKSLVDKLVAVLSSTKHIISTPLLDRSSMLSTYRAAKKRLFMFDYDGTLTPIVREPSAALPSHSLIQSLKILAADPQNAVWIISGRDQGFLTQHLGDIKELGFSAEHGSFMRHPGSTDWENLAETFDMGWQKEVLEVFQKFTDPLPGSFIERKRCALTWHYRLADPEQGLKAARQCQKELDATVAQKWEVDVMPGKANLEVRPTFINKGEIAKRLVKTYNEEATKTKSGAVEFVLCLGDDFTDEDMFRALNGLSAPPVLPAGQEVGFKDGGKTKHHFEDEEKELKGEQVFTVTVGASTKVTLARWHVLEPEDVIECIALLAGQESGPLAVTQNNLAAVSAVEGEIPSTI